MPFMFIFTMFVVTFGLVGHLLYGPLLYEWSTVGLSMVTSIDLIMGGYGFTSLKVAIGDEDYMSLVVAAIYFYVYFFLMMLVVMNIVIAILMDGYASVKEMTGSSVEEQIKYNMEAEGSIIMLAMKDQVNSVVRVWHLIAQKSHMAKFQLDKWSDERWIHDLNQVISNRKERLETQNLMRIGTLVAEIKALPTTDKDEDVAWQVLHMFQSREWKAPDNIEDPFTEPKVDQMVVQLIDYMREQDTRNRMMMTLVTEMHTHQLGPEVKAGSEDPVSLDGVRSRPKSPSPTRPASP